MRPNREVNYEVQVGGGGRWTIDSVHPRKDDAVRRAEALAGAGRYDGVKVLEDSGGKPKVVFEKAVARAEKPITISPVESAPPCASADDFFRFDSRLTIGRLLRAFLDDIGATALELLTDFGRIRQLTRMETLYNQALHCIAGIQARQTGAKPHERYDFLHRAVVELTERARECKDADRLHQVLKEQGIEAMVTAANAEFSDPYRAYVKHAVLARHLSTQADWSGKIALALEDVENGVTGEGLRLLDEAIAEIMDGGEAIQAMLGGQADLGSALRALAQLASGSYKGAGGRGSCLPRLNAALGHFELEVTRYVLLARVERGLRSIKPLTRENAQADCDAFTALVKGLIGPAGLYGGPEMSEAVTMRGRMAFGEVASGDLSPENGVARLQELMPNRAVRLGYLLDLGRTPFAAKHQAVVLKALMVLIQEMPNINALLPSDTPRKAQEAIVADLKKRIEKSALPPEMRAQIIRRLDKMLAGEAVAKEAVPTISVPQVQPPPEILKALEGRCKLGRKTFNAGDSLFRQGDPGDEAYIVTSGEIEIFVKNGSGERHLSTVRRGDIIGEMSLINRAPRVASARAKTPVVVTVIPPETFQARLDRLSETDRVMHKLLESFADRLRQMFENPV
jgi:hypothetical protein